MYGTPVDDISVNGLEVVSFYPDKPRSEYENGGYDYAVKKYGAALDGVLMGVSHLLSHRGQYNALGNI
jgi:hypothetical protein